MTTTNESALEETRHALEKMYGDRLIHIVLYGSQARGDARLDSDVDVMVVLDGPFDLYAETRRLVRLEAEMMERYDTFLSFQPFSAEEFQKRQSPFMINVRKEGVVL